MEHTRSSGMLRRQMPWGAFRSRGRSRREKSARFCGRMGRPRLNPAKRAREHARPPWIRPGPSDHGPRFRQGEETPRRCPGGAECRSRTRIGGRPHQGWSGRGIRNNALRRPTRLRCGRPLRSIRQRPLHSRLQEACRSRQRPQTISSPREYPFPCFRYPLLTHRMLLECKRVPDPGSFMTRTRTVPAFPFRLHSGRGTARIPGQEGERRKAEGLNAHNRIGGDPC